MAINLLPKDLLPSAGLIKTAKLLKNLLTLGFGIFTIALVGLVAFFTLNSISLRSSSARQEELKTSIKALEQTEQGLVLVKDRLAKVKEVLGKDSGAEEIDNLAKVSSLTTAGVDLTEAVVFKDELDTTFNVSDASLLTSFMAQIIATGTYKRIDLNSFSFNPSVGYLISLAFVTK